MLTDIKYLKYVKRLCWSNKVKVRIAVFNDDEICVFTSRWCQYWIR
jgi:hypothetical protein